jgi:AP-1-like transcription factor
VKEVEERLQELEAKYSDLSQSYDALQIEYTVVKKELEKLMGDEERIDGASPNENACNISLSDSAYETPQGGLLEYSPFDESEFCFEQESIGENRDFGGV